MGKKVMSLEDFWMYCPDWVDYIEMLPTGDDTGYGYPIMYSKTEPNDPVVLEMDVRAADRRHDRPTEWIEVKFEDLHKYVGKEVKIKGDIFGILKSVGSRSGVIEYKNQVTHMFGYYNIFYVKELIKEPDWIPVSLKDLNNYIGKEIRVVIKLPPSYGPPSICVGKLVGYDLLNKITTIQDKDLIRTINHSCDRPNVEYYIKG